MTKIITIDERSYAITECTAIASCDLEDGVSQDALLVKYTNEYDEEITAVVFGYEMPEDAEGLAAMIDEPYAWEFDWEVLETVR